SPRKRRAAHATTQRTPLARRPTTSAMQHTKLATRRAKGRTSGRSPRSAALTCAHLRSFFPAPERLYSRGMKTPGLPLALALALLPLAARAPVGVRLQALRPAEP